MTDLVEKELSYTIIGALFNVYNHLGGGYQEKYYQKAVAQELRNHNLQFVEQVAIPLSYKGEPIGRHFLDFLVNDRIVLEIKAAGQFYPRDVKQVLAYLKATQKPLAILSNFSRFGLQLKRVLRGSTS